MRFAGEKGNIMKKLWKISLIVFLILTLSGLPVYAQQQEQGTAGATIKQQILQDLQRKERATAGWVQDGAGWWYQESDGTYPTTAWRKIDEKWYYFDSRGYWVPDNSYEKGTLKGIDVSYYQGNIDWQAVKADGVQFAFLRIGRSPRVLDEKYREYIQRANAAGIPVGVYYYSKAQSEGEAVLDAQFVIQNLKGYKVSYPVAIDVEDASMRNLGKAKVASIVKAFCDEIRAAGYTPMLYANENWCRNYIDLNQLGNVEKWIARYNYFWSEDLQRGIWQCSSKGRITGIEGNVDIDFSYKDYTKIVTPRTAPVAGYIPAAGKWVQDSTGTWYSYYSGGYPSGGWKQIDGYWYWFSAAGYMKTGWLYESGSWYWLGNDGRMRTGWVSVNGAWYYMNTSGRMLSNRWVGDYYLKSSGAMATNEWVDGGKYYVDGSGKWVPGKTQPAGTWKRDGNGWWYQNADGSYPRNTWKLINNEWYWFGSNGYMKTGWVNVSGTWYYMDASGRMLSNRWVGNYYLKSNGAMATNERVDGGRYYVDASGNWVPGK